MKLRVVKLRAVDLLFLAVASSIVWGAGMLVAFYAGKEPLMPFLWVWLGGINFAIMTWILEFALPYLHRKWQQRIARHRKKRPGGAVDVAIGGLEAYCRYENDQAAVDKMFRERKSGKITPMIQPSVAEKENDNEDAAEPS